MRDTVKSRRKESRQVLGVITETDADTLLTELANLRDESLSEENPIPAGITKWWKQVFDFLPPEGPARLYMLRRLCGLIRKAWTESNRRARDWYLFRAREERFRFRIASNPEIKDLPEAWRLRSIDDALDEAPAVSPWEAAVFHLQQIEGTTRKCDNQECANPYFIAKKQEGGQQRYCTPECADVGRRESKRNWWREHRGKGEHDAKRNDRKNR
jgi:hypothetical protein